MSDMAKAVFAGFFMVIAVFIVFTSSWTSGIIDALGGGLAKTGSALETGKTS